MNKTLISLALLSAFAAPVMAKASDAAIGTAGTVSMLLARHGADDPIGDKRGGEGPGHAARLAKNGADDPIGDKRRGEGPGHKARLAKNGADDPIGDKRRGEGPGHAARLA